MSGSTLNPPEEGQQTLGIGHDTASLGPSDSSDSGSDTLGARRREMDVDDSLDAHALEEGPLEFDANTDTSGTGERALAEGDGGFRPDADILPDSIESIEDIVDDTADIDLDGPDRGPDI
ncbi:hypothetical protein [Chitinasiproducens palmae]|uniref:Chemotaxis protein n=1 Tax=Chitinasiproducens palmae TaxID=1770053 RepID=A0A1H2PMI4_9BURK|nr:hypothetical protein [Chitinasiproducens palmae]SDV47713.1 hypothetical protein SAMN05216551_103238 [Chitinasiproducens palmae]